VDAPVVGIIPGLIWAFRIHPDGRAEAIDISQPIEEVRSCWLWLHLNLVDQRARPWLDSLPDVPAEARQLCVAADAYQQLHATETCVFGIIGDLLRDLDHPTNEIGYLHFVMTEQFVISGRRHPLHAVDATRQALRKGLRLASVASLLDTIVDQVVDAIDQMANRFAVELDEIEDRLVVHAGRKDRIELGRLRRTTVRLHRQLASLRGLFHRLERERAVDVPSPLRMETGRLAQRLDGLDHEIIGIRERARLLQEEVAARLTEETGRRLHVLSIVTTLFLPATLVAGIFGMNTKGLPFTESDTGFWWAVALAAAARKAAGQPAREAMRSPVANERAPEMPMLAA